MTRIRAFRAALLAVLALPLIAFAQAQPRVRYDGHRLVEVELKTPAELERMLAISGDFWSCSIGLGRVPFRVPPEQMAALDASGLRYVVLNENVQTLLDAEERDLSVRRADWFASYHPYDEINAYLDTLVALRPDLATKLDLGPSLENRRLYGIQITGSDGPAGKAGLLFNGCQHAREWVAVMVPMYVADRLIRTYDTDAGVRSLLADAIVYVVPIVNPDGYAFTWNSERLWRKNRRNNGDGSFGVDNNRNWGYQWGGSGSSGVGSDETYRGTAPFSEPETQRMRDFVLAHPELVAHIDFHSYGQLILSPWGYSTGEPAEPDRTLFRDINALMEAEIEAVHGLDYISGPIGATLYLAAGNAVDWVYGGAGVHSWTIELRPDGSPGFLLPADEILPTSEENWAGVIALAQSTVAGVIVSFPNGVPTSVPADEAVQLDVRVDEYASTVPGGAAVLYSRIGSGAFNAVALTPLGSGLYTTELPATPCGESLEFYVEVTPTSGIAVHEPPGAPAAPYSLPAVRTILMDSLEIESGWSVGASGDDATTGVWNRMDPQPTAAQPGDDATVAGTLCWVTDGNAGATIGSFDVDGGKTTLTSPLLDLGDTTDPTLEYARWYSNDQGASPNEDIFVVDLSTDGGQNWTNVETVGPSGPGTSGGWITHSFRLLDFGVPTAQVRLRFIASDEGSGSIVEAAVDELRITEVCAAACPTDLDDNGVTDLLDLSILLSAFGSCDGSPDFVPAADFDDSGCVDLLDLSTMLTAFGTNCP